MGLIKHINIIHDSFNEKTANWKSLEDTIMDVNFGIWDGSIPKIGAKVEGWFQRILLAHFALS